MTYYGARELAASFRTVRANTIKIAEEIPEQHYGYRITPETRTVGETLAHIALSPRFQERIHVEERRTTMEGFDFFGFLAAQAKEEGKARGKQEIVALLHSEGERFAHTLEGLPEETLAEKVRFPQGMQPPEKTRFEMLMGSKEHEMHHRGQLMVAERLLGIVPHLTRQMEERIASMKAAQVGKAGA